jgi:hypothetical protein
MSLYEFEKYIKEVHPDEYRTLELIKDYHIFKNAPLNELFEKCPWIKEKTKTISEDRVFFNKLQIKDLLDHGYEISVSETVNRDNHYKCQYMPYEYCISISISKDEIEIVEFDHEDTESHEYTLTNFREFDEVELYEE